MGPSSRGAVIGFEGQVRNLLASGDQGEQQAGEITHVDDRKMSLRRERHDSPSRQLEQLEHLGVARAVDGRRTHHGPVKTAGLDDLLSAQLGPTIDRQARFARRERRDVDEARDPRLQRGVDDVERAPDVAVLEALLVGRVDHAGDVQDDAGPADQALEGALVIEITLNPFDANARILRAAGKRADLDPGAGGIIEHGLADEAGGSGNRQQFRRHYSSTIWSRWISAERGA